MNKTIKTSISGPRWANITNFLFQASVAYGFDLEILYRDKGWFREEVFFKMSGERNMVEGAYNEIVRQLEEHNKS
jgi:hypothetical protein